MPVFVAITNPRYLLYVLWRNVMRACAWLSIRLVVAGNPMPMVDEWLTALHDYAHLQAARLDRRSK